MQEDKRRVTIQSLNKRVNDDMQTLRDENKSLRKEISDLKIAMYDKIQELDKSEEIEDIKSRDYLYTYKQEVSSGFNEVIEFIAESCSIEGVKELSSKLDLFGSQLKLLDDRIERLENSSGYKRPWWKRCFSFLGF